MKTLIISLARAKDRRRQILRQATRAHLDYELIEAVDGLTLDTNDANLVSANWVRETNRANGRIACQLSHIQAYKAILQAGASHALIVEDDALLPRNLAPVVEEAANHLSLAEVLLLHLYSGATHGAATTNDLPVRPPCRLSVQNATSLSSGHMITYPIDLRHVTGAAAYIITAQGCHSMVRRLVPVHTDADAWSYFQSQHILDRVRCLAPLPVHPNPRFGSTINHGRYSWRDHIYDAMEHVPIPPATTLLTLRRHRYYKRLSQIVLVPDPPANAERRQT